MELGPKEGEQYFKASVPQLDPPPLCLQKFLKPPPSPYLIMVVFNTYLEVPLVTRSQRVEFKDPPVSIVASSVDR